MQQQIVDIIRRLEDAGEITVHGDEEEERSFSRQWQRSSGASGRDQLAVRQLGAAFRHVLGIASLSAGRTRRLPSPYHLLLSLALPPPTAIC